MGAIYGVRIYHNSPHISHLLFVDDSFFFFQANVEECSTVKRILHEYEMASKQVVNFLKSSISLVGILLLLYVIVYNLKWVFQIL